MWLRLERRIDFVDAKVFTEALFISVSTVLRGYVDLVTWPVVTLVAVILYRKVVYRLLSGGKIEITIAGVEIETTLPQLEASITESLHGAKLTTAQWGWLRRLYTDGRTRVLEDDKSILRPLRDSALLRAYPEGHLGDATHVEITNLGRLLVKAAGET
jgi:hypothetical protein